MVGVLTWILISRHPLMAVVTWQIKRMKIRSRLTRSFSTLTQAVIPLFDNDRIAFLESLRNWYLFYLGGIHDPSKRGYGLKLLLDSPLDEIPVTKESINHVKHQLARYASGDMEWTLSAAEALINDICALRDWDDCCINDQFDLEYVFDIETSRVLKTCTSCGYTLDTTGNIHDRPERYRTALRSDLMAAGVIKEAT